MKRLLVLLLVCLATPAAAQMMGPSSPQARMQLESRDAYAGMPFGVAVVAEGFDADPAPAQPTLTMPGATVTPLGAEPSVQRITINGRRFDSVTWVFRWRVEAPKAGEYTVPSVTITQGDKKATAAGGELEVIEIETTDDMRIQLELPARPVWLGEVVPVHIDWLLRRDVGDQELAVPLLAMPDDLAVTVPPATDPRHTLALPAGATELEVPYVRDQVTVDGQPFTRFRFTVQIAPQRAGSIAIPPAQVVANLEIGQTRDRFGFSTPRTKLFRATDIARTLEVRPLPQQGRPESFAGAVGTSFAITARTSRSVVQLGEPVELEITVKSDTRLDGLALGPITGPGRLPPSRFQAADTAPPGELADDGFTKTFRVPVQVVDPATTEIPPIELAWFDPVAAQYRTARSEPIALSVKGGSVVGAGQVVGGRRPDAPASSASGATPDVSLVGADLALSAPAAAGDRPLSGGILWALVALLYGVPLVILGVRTWQVRTTARRAEASEVTAARRRVDDELARARTAPARDVVGPLVAALRALARAAGRDAADPLLERLETEGFAPQAATAPLSEALRDEAAALARRWASEPRATRAAATAVVLLIALVPAPAAAQVEDGRAAYQNAMASTDPTIRQREFARAAAAFEEAAAATPDRVELLTDWGNAALGAADFGEATLAYRRALAIDPDHGRARKNLAWLRSRLSDTFRPREGGATATLFFFHTQWTRGARLLGGALAFAVAALLLVPWRRRPSGGRIALALVPAAIWVLLTGSVLLERDASRDGVVLDVQLLRSADSAGAPPALATPVPPGAEVTIVERRDGWTRIRTAGGATGWLPDTSVATVVPPRR